MCGLCKGGRNDTCVTFLRVLISGDESDRSIPLNILKNSFDTDNNSFVMIVNNELFWGLLCPMDL